jgi:ribosomal-protein-alanine N-acetyltransferase
METFRLLLFKLSAADAAFMFELLNTPLWIKFIGDRNIKTIADAEAYIQKVNDNPTADYWVVKLKDQQTTLGVVTFMKRDYLDHYDIGFAFLPAYNKQGYAYEASKRLLEEVNPHHQQIVATVLKENKSSIQLIEKLGLQLDKEIVVNNEALLLYSTRPTAKTIVRK